METRRRRARPAAAPRGQEIEPGLRDRLVREAVPRLRQVVQRELAVREAETDLDPGQIDVDDVVDQVIADVLPTLGDRPPDTGDALFVLLQERVPVLLDAFAAALAEEAPQIDEAEHRGLHAAPQVPASPGTGTDDTRTTPLVDDPAGEHVVPTVALEERVALPRVRGDREEAVTEEAGREVLLRLLDDLPAERRRIFEAVVVDARPEGQVAMEHALTPDRVREEVALAADTLAEELGSRGARTREDVIRLYEELGVELREEEG